MNETTIELNDGLKQIPIKEKRFSLREGDIGGNRYIREENIGEVKHRNYLDYLEICYAKHYSPVVRPDFIWYELLCELAIMVKEKPENFREFFTASKEKTEIVVLSDSLDKLPLDEIMDMFKELVPSGSENYMPVFSTSTPDATEAFFAAFADACSPFYNYSMLLCGFPSIIIQGTPEDWSKLSDYWKNLSKIKLFSKCDKSIKEYVEDVQFVLDTCRDSLGDKPHWKDMFKVENCGSGHDRQLRGWIVDLFRVKPHMAYPENFSSHVSKVEYKQLNTKKEYTAYYGLFSSEIDGHILRPKYGCIITETIKKKEKSKRDDSNDSLDIALSIVSSKIEAKQKKLNGVWTVSTD